MEKVAGGNVDLCNFNYRVLIARLNIALIILFILSPTREGSKGKFLSGRTVTEQSHIYCLILIKRSAVLNSIYFLLLL